jgi:hypothetical protein
MSYESKEFPTFAASILPLGGVGAFAEVLNPF